jgi:endonuclease YncB( thermonuclease family)
MTISRRSAFLWQTAPARVAWLPAGRRRVLGLFGRSAGFLAATAVLGCALLASAPRADQARPGGPPAASDLTAITGGIAATVAGGDAAAIFASSPTAALTRFTGAAAPVGPSTGSFLRGEASPEASWREEDFASVTIVDGRTLQAGSLRIRLVGLDLPLPEQVCRTLDGRLEHCTVRAATQLELLTRWRRVSCRYRPESLGEAIGRCRVGTSDLTDRMVQTGYAWRSAAPSPEEAGIGRGPEQTNRS